MCLTMFRKIAIVSYIFHVSSCDWVSEWMSPIQEQLNEKQSRRGGDNIGASIFDDGNLKMVQVVDSTERTQNLKLESYPEARGSKTQLSTASLKSKLEDTLQNAKMLAATLKTQIREVLTREKKLKEAIVNGRSGVSSVLVSMIDRPTRAYIIRDGVWTLCLGSIHAPETTRTVNDYNDLFNAPKCLGQEVTTQQDPCVFNSVIKYETVPIMRRVEYSEDEYLCLKQTFNNTLERYMSVPRNIINATCQNGLIRSLEDNNIKCGLRVMSEYTYYPLRGFGSSLPLEYCNETDGSCKLIMAWHVSNSTVENFEFLKNEQEFKKYFIRSSGYTRHLI